MSGIHGWVHRDDGLYPVDEDGFVIDDPSILEECLGIDADDETVLSAISAPLIDIAPTDVVDIEI